MGSPIRITTRTMQAGLELTYATDSGVSGILIHEGATFTPVDGQLEPRQNIMPAWGSRDTLRVTEYGTLTFRCDLAGSGTQDVSPQWGPLLIGCGWEGTTFSSSVSGTAQAGSTTTITLAAGASALDHAYVGAIINFTGGTGHGQVGEIVAYDPITKVCTLAETLTTALDDTTQYQIGKRIAWRAVSDAAIDGSSLALYWGEGAIRHVFLGARGSVKLVFEALKLPYLEFTYTGLLGTISDQSIPVIDSSTWLSPKPFNQANVGGMYFHGYRSPDIKLARFEFDQGGDVQYRNLPGYEGVDLVDRMPKTRFTVDTELLADANYWSPLRNSTPGAVAFRVGTVAGNRIMVVIPRHKILRGTYGDDRKISQIQAEGEAYTGFALGGSTTDDDIFLISR